MSGNFWRPGRSHSRGWQRCGSPRRRCATHHASDETHQGRIVSDLSREPDCAILVLPMVRAANWAKHRNADNHNEVFLLADFSKYCSKLNSLTFCFCVNGSVAQTNDAA